jgi:pimeloyl-ACP methyl ester carboxylesterase
VGQVAVEPCPDVLDGAVCGHIARPWDPTGAVPGRIRIGFAFLPATDSPAGGTVVAQEGGPGYPSTGSMSSYADLFAPLLDRRNLLVVDARGTGTSQAIDCPELQELTGAYAPAAAKCAARLGSHSHLYGTDLAADDMAAVITALGLGQVDLYGDSYGTFFSQVFAGRHGDLLRTLVLDAAYPAYGEDAWYDTQGPALSRSLATVCADSAWCSDAGGSAGKRFRQLLNLVRNDPLSGSAPAADGQKEDAYVDPAELAFVAYNGTYVPTAYRELDAAARAALAGDTLPMLRLAAEADNPGGGVSTPEEYSEGLDAAVSCRDYPQVYDLMASPKVRRAQLAAAIAQKEQVDPRVYAPFTIQEYLDSGWSTIDWCTDWPAPPADYAPAPPMPPSGHYPDVPTLVLNGELDTLTTPAEGRIVAGQFPNATRIQVTSGLHVTALGDLDGCASRIVRFFVSHARVGDTSCAAELPPLRTAPPFWRTVSDATPAKAKSGSTTDSARLRAVSVAAATAGDAMYRWWQTYEVGGLGLRGGSWTADGNTTLEFTLTGYRFAQDLAVSGHVTWDMVAGTATVNLRLAGASAVAGRLVGSWDTKAAGAKAILTGTLGGEAVNASVLAP